MIKLTIFQTVNPSTHQFTLGSILILVNGSKGTLSFTSFEYMSFKEYFNINKLRQSLLQPEEPGSRKHCAGTARLVAAYFLGWPLFELEDDTQCYPTLFEWQHVSASSVPGKKIPHEVVTQEIPEEFFPRLPVALLLHLAHDLEAVLYTDHFCDRRSSLIVRLLVDDALGLSLTDEYVAESLLTVVENQSRKGIEGCSFICEKLVPAVLELDVVLAKNYIRSLENYAIDQVDILFAQLPIKCSDVKQLHRPPVYMLSPPTHLLQGEAAILMRIHNFLKLVLTSLSLTNRLQGDLRRTVNMFAEPEAILSGGKTVIGKLTVSVLGLTYRDSFTLAEEEKWKELPEVAMKYKALIDGEDEQEAIRRWHSLAEEQDLEHAHLFFEFVKSFGSSQNTLPPLDASTREIWHDHLCHNEEDNAHSIQESIDWISGLLLINRKVPAELWEQMKFITTYWKGLAIPDTDLIPLRLHLSPDVLCKPLPPTPRQVQSAREQLESTRQVMEDRLFMPRSQILEQYTLKAKEERVKRRLKEKRKAQTHREPRFMRNSISLQKFAESQSMIRDEVENEKAFLKSPLKAPVALLHSLNTTPCTSSSSSLSCTSINLREDAIRKDIKRLDEKIETIGKMLVEERRNKEELLSARMERSLSGASSIIPLPDNYKEIPASEAPPLVEKLDFTMLSPSPRPRPISLDEKDELESEPVEGSEDEVRSQLSTFSMSTANSMHDSITKPAQTLIRPQTDRLPLLHYERTQGKSSPVHIIEIAQAKIVTSERSAQTRNMTLGEMKPMSRADISALYRHHQTE